MLLDVSTSIYLSGNLKFSQHKIFELRVHPPNFQFTYVRFVPSMCLYMLYFLLALFREIKPMYVGLYTKCVFVFDLIWHVVCILVGSYERLIYYPILGEIYAFVRGTILKIRVVEK
jgi:hypothetical protein